jgi:hypothetical protein
MGPGTNESAGKGRGRQNDQREPLLAGGADTGRLGGKPSERDLSGSANQRLVRRMGKKKALVAAGHSILVIVYHVLKNKVSYQERGEDYFDRRNVASQRKRLLRQLESLGLKVTVEEIEVA